MSKLKSLDGLSAGRRFGCDVIILCVRWYLRHKLTLRDLRINETAACQLLAALLSLQKNQQIPTPELLQRPPRFAVYPR